MVLIRTDWKSFGAYLASLNKPARKNYKSVMKQYGQSCMYSEYTGGAFPLALIHGFMGLWEQQLVRGKHPQWAFPVATVHGWWESRNLKIFTVYDDFGAIGVQFIQARDGYWECHPPMYDKNRHPSMAKFMWFMLIQHAIERGLAPLDMGGGSDDWHYMLRNRDQFPNTKYKWAFVPEHAKLNPDSEPKYFIGRPACKLLLMN